MRMPFTLFRNTGNGWWKTIGINQCRPNCTHPFFKVEHKPVRRVAIQVISVELFATQEAQPLVQFDRASIGDFGLEDDLPKHVQVSHHTLEICGPIAASTV